MFGAEKGTADKLDGKKLHIGIVQARFNESITNTLASACLIRGETYHFELVANESGAGVTRLSLDYQIPIANAIITTENMEQAIARQSDKGTDAARVAVEMANLLDEVS